MVRENENTKLLKSLRILEKGSVLAKTKALPFIVLQQRNKPPVELGEEKRFSKDKPGELKASRIEENKTSQYN